MVAKHLRDLRVTYHELDFLHHVASNLLDGSKVNHSC